MATKARGSTAKAAPASADVLAAALAAALVDTALPGEADGLDAAQRGAIGAAALQAAATRAVGVPSLALDAAHADPANPTRRRVGLAIANDDMPFLVDSISGAITAAGLGIDRLLHPVIDVRRDATGALTDVLGPAGGPVPSGAIRESLIYMELERTGARARGELQESLEGVLGDVRAAVEDWPAMLRLLRDAARNLADYPPPIAPHALAEATAFLDWLAADSFTLLGARRYELAGDLDDPAMEPTSDAGLGLLRDPDFPVWSGERGAAPAQLKRLLASHDPLLISKAGAVSTVHRRATLDLISVKGFDRVGRVVSETRFIGLFTSAALAASPRSVPLLRRKVGEVIDRLGFSTSGHTGKALIHVLESFPREELFEASADRLTEVALGLLSLTDRPRPKLFARADAFGRFVSALAYVPRDAYDSGVRERVGAMLADALDGRVTRYDVELRAEGLARVHYTVATATPERLDEADLNRRLDRLVRGWDEALETALTGTSGPARAARLAMTHGKAFSAAYRAHYAVDEAAADIMALTSLSDTAERAVRLFRRPDDAADQLRLKIYRLGAVIPLSEAVPVLENFGLRVIEELPFGLADGKLGWIHDFLVETPAPVTDLDVLRLRVEPALIGVLTGRLENDAFNALLIAGGLDAISADWLRAYFRYLRQTGVAYGLTTVVDALRRHPALAAALVDLFRARFALDIADRAATIEAADVAINAGLARVAAIDDDAIIRRLRAVMRATLRTNAFVPGGPEALAFKLDSAAVPGLPKPVPYREIWVHSRRVEGIHLRGGPIARGGLRWSDRRDDFRTEVLSLVKAQKVKNAVIVPTGAKGGFYPKQLPSPSNRDAWAAEGRAAYQVFVRALLSLTDDLDPAGTVLPPEGVVRHDQNDPYLVVAADKGTATFSDTANAISAAHAGGRGFWLRDAFASGGGNGYDHKAMGITARGAWISVQRHFRERGVDVQAEPVRVAGVGDMSGDVFGNGLLLSEAVRLVAAFDHRHIFLDPEPDAAASFAERRRLFAFPRSSWDDYDKALISPGGGVFARTLKSIPLTAQVRALLGVEADVLTPAELIVAILKARLDLMWFGGIGTYVKASTESHADAGDRSNDAQRVDARELGATVIGEGANLALTQAARIEFAAAGGRLNTDFIDNSAGVDCSDNEVNIKIALNAEVAGRRLSLDDRNALLVEMTDEVAELVLADNRLQTQALSIAEAGGAAALAGHRRLIQALEVSEAALDRKVEGLAADEALAQRGRDGHGLERPELAVVMAYAKMAIYDALVDAPVVDDPLLVDDLLAAFPPQMVERFRPAIEAHRLRRELIATKLANQLVNRGGLGLAFELAEELGSSLAEVGAAFVATRALFGFPALWEAIDTAAIPGPVQLALHGHAIELLRTHMADVLRATNDRPPHALVGRLCAGISRLSAGVADLLRPEVKAQLDRYRAQLDALGAPEPIAARMAQLAALDGAVGVGLLAADLGVPEAAIAQAYTRLGEALGLDWAKGAAAGLNPADPWERLLVAGLVRDFEQLRLDLIGRVTPAGGDPVAAADEWLRANASRAARLAGPVARAKTAGGFTTAMVAHLASQARGVLAA